MTIVSCTLYSFSEYGGKGSVGPGPRVRQNATLQSKIVLSWTNQTACFLSPPLHAAACAGACSCCMRFCLNCLSSWGACKMLTTCKSSACGCLLLSQVWLDSTATSPFLKGGREMQSMREKLHIVDVVYKSWVKRVTDIICMKHVWHAWIWSMCKWRRSKNEQKIDFSTLTQDLLPPSQ